MRSRMASTRGPQRVLVTILVLVVLAGVFQYWRLRTVNADLTDRLVRLEGLLQATEEKSSKIDSQRKEVNEDLKKVNANLQQLEITKEEEVTKCKHMQENLAELEEKRAILQKELDDEKDNNDRELGDMAKKLKSLQTQLADSQQTSRKELNTAQQQLTVAQQELQRTRQQLAGAQLGATNAATCHTQLTQVQSELARCQSVASAGGQAVAGQLTGGQAVAGQPVGGQAVVGQPVGGQAAAGQLAGGQAAAGQLTGGQAVAGQLAGGQAAAGQPVGGQGVVGQPVAGGQAVSAAVPGGSRGPWPGLQAPQGQIGQQLFESAGLGGFNQAQGRAGLAPVQHRVIPAPPGAGAAPSSSSTSSTSSSSQKPAVGQGMLAKPQSREEAGPGADAVEGAGVLAPPHPAPGSLLHPQEQQAPPAAAEPQLGLDDVNLQYPNEAAKDVLDDHPDTDHDPDAKEAALIKGLQELSNKSGQPDGLVGPVPPVDPGADSAHEMVGAVAMPELTGQQQPPLPLR